MQAVKEMVGNKARVIFAKGCNLTNEPMLAKASGLKVDPVENTRLVKEARLSLDLVSHAGRVTLTGWPPKVHNDPVVL